MSFVFLSHRSADKPRIRPFVLDLIARGIPAWIDRVEEFNVDIPPGERPIRREELGGGIELARDWPVQIDKALMQSFAVVVFWSVNWTRDRDILVREHGAAHIFGNVGYSTYIPVLLDEDAKLDRDVIAYREAVHDNVQAYNIARYGEAHWHALAVRLQELWDAHRNERTQTKAQYASHPSERALDNTDWFRELISPRSPQHTVELLAKIPLGPAFDPWLLTPGIRRAYANGITDVEAPLLVSEAAALVLQTFSEDCRRNPDRLVVMRSAVPSIFHVGATHYWSSVLDHACILGPRMVAAILLCAPPSVLQGSEQATAETLQQMEVWK